MSIPHEQYLQQLAASERWLRDTRNKLLDKATALGISYVLDHDSIVFEGSEEKVRELLEWEMGEIHMKLKQAAEGGVLFPAEANLGQEWPPVEIPKAT